MARVSLPGPVRLVLADSLAFHGPQRAEPADGPRRWPDVAASALGGRPAVPVVAVVPPSHRGR
jgi:hypothetical protein